MKQTIISQFEKLIAFSRLEGEKGWQFSVKNYQKVNAILKAETKPLTSLTEIVALLKQNGMFKSENKPPYKSKILIKIGQILEGKLVVSPEHTQRLQDYQQLISIPEVGPSKAKQLLNDGITFSQLQENPSLLNRKQQIGLRYYQDLQQRIPRSEMDLWLHSLLARLTHRTCQILQIPEKLIKMDLTGSYRRGQDSSGDIDFYIALPETHIKNFMSTLVRCLIENNILNQADIFSQGEKKMMSVARLTDKSLARHLDVFIFPIHQYPFALLFATGCGEFNVKMRQFALKHGWSLSDKALLLKNNKGRPPNLEELQSKDLLSIQTENDIFQFLSLDYVEPHLRTPKHSFVRTP